MVLERNTLKAEIVFRALGLLSQENARRLNDPDEDLAESERAALIAEQELVEAMAAVLV